MEPLSIDLIKRALLKRFWPIVLVTGFGSVLAILVAYVIPPVFVSSAKILVESQQIPTSLAQPTVTASANERLELIRQRLMTRANVASLIERLGLFRDEPDLSLGAKVARVRASTSFEKIAINASRRGGGEVGAFVLSYRSNNGAETARVANEMVTLVLEQNLLARSSRANETLEFFDKEAQRLQAELIRTESELAEFKRENGDALPDGLEFRQKELADLRGRRFDLERKLLDMEKQLRELEERLVRGQYGPDFEQERSPQQVALARLEQDLSAASAIYAPSHPTIRRIRTQIARIESSLSPAQREQNATDRDEIMAEARADLIEEIDLQKKEIRLAREELEGLAVRREELKTSIARTPQVGIDLNSLERRLAGLQVQFQETVRKRSAAETGQKLEVNQQAERFEVIEQAQTPDGPESPNRVMIAALGSVASLGLSVGLAVLFEMLNRAIYTASDLERRLQLRPLMTIPYIRTEADRRRSRMRFFLAVIVIVVLPLLALYAIDQYYMPLDLLMDKVLARTGLDGVIDMVRRRLFN